MKRTKLLYILASVLSGGLLVLLFLVFTQTSFLDRVHAIFGRGTEEVLPLNDLEQGNGGVSIPSERLTQEGDSAFSTGNLTDAMRFYEQALETGADIPVIRKVFQVALLLRDTEKAEVMLGLLSFRGVGEETLDALRGLLFLREDDRTKAAELFAKYPESPDHAYGRVLLAILEKKHEEAEAALLIMQRSSDPLLVHAAQTIQGAYDEFALFEDGRETHRLTLLTRALAQVNQCPVAETLLHSVLQEEPDYRDAWIILGYCKLVLQDFAGSLTAFEEAYKLDPEKAETQYFLGLAHERLGNAPQAKTFFTYALENGFEPSKAVREKLAELSKAEGAYADAAAQYRAILAIEQTPESYHALVTLLIEKLDQVDEAFTLAREARDALGDLPLILDLLGWTELLKGDINQAAAFLTVAVEQDPTLASAWYHKGLLAEKAGDTDEALRSYREAYTLSLGNDIELVKTAAERHNALVKQ
jgi:tetratricopeptide (TPR) repeat protein